MSPFQFFSNKILSIQHKRLFKRALAQTAPQHAKATPEITEFGDYNRGLDWLSGDLFRNYYGETEIPKSPWSLPVSTPYIRDILHGFEWLDDLHAVGTAEADRKMYEWTYDWIDRFNQGEGQGWTPSLAGWRIIRLLTHSKKLLQSGRLLDQEKFLKTISVHVHYISEVYNDDIIGLEQLLSMTGWLYAALSFDEYQQEVDNLVSLIGIISGAIVDGEHVHLESRNPEELSIIFCLLVWSENYISQQGKKPTSNHELAIETIGKTLRTLRMGNGALVEAHGGGSNHTYSIERVISSSQVSGSSRLQPCMGFLHNRSGATKVIMDVGQIPSDINLNRAHASSLALWVSHGNHVLFGSKGPASHQGLNERLRSQETVSHSTLVLDQQSSSELGLPSNDISEIQSGGFFSSPANVSDIEYNESETETLIKASHDGYAQKYGIIHERKLTIERDGLFLAGIDLLHANNHKNPNQLEQILKQRGKLGVPFEIRFIMGAPIQEVNIDPMRNLEFYDAKGNRWILNQIGGAIEVADEQIFKSNRAHPVSTNVISIKSRLISPSGYISWSLQLLSPSIK